MKNIVRSVAILALIVSHSTAKAHSNSTAVLSHILNEKVSDKPADREEYLSRNGIQSRVYYDKFGNVTSVRRDYVESELNPFIKARFYQQYPEQKIFGITEVTTKEGMAYIIIAQSEKQWYHIYSTDSGQMMVAQTYNKSGH